MIQNLKNLYHPFLRKFVSLSFRENIFDTNIFCIIIFFLNSFDTNIFVSKNILSSRNNTFCIIENFLIQFKKLKICIKLGWYNDILIQWYLSNADPWSRDPPHAQTVSTSLMSRLVKKRKCYQVLHFGSIFTENQCIFFAKFLLSPK